MGAIRITDLEGPRGLRGLAADFDRAAAIAPAESRKVVAKGSLNIKNDARQRSSGIAHAPNYPLTITYDTYPTPAGAWGEIGPDKAKKVGGGPHQTPGDLGALLEYGSVNNAPRPHLAPALAAEKPRFEQAMQDLAVKTLGWS